MRYAPLPLLAVTLLALGCATPPAVHELADKTSANVGVVSARLKQLADESNRLFISRAENVSHLQGVNATQRASFAYDVALTKRSGQQADLDSMKELQAWVQEVDVILGAAIGAEKTQRDALIAGQAKLDAKAGSLQKVAETLSALAKEESVAERVKMLQKFSKEVRDDVNKELDDGSESSKRAKALIEHARGATAPGTPH